MTSAMTIGVLCVCTCCIAAASPPAPGGELGTMVRLLNKFHDKQALPDSPAPAPARSGFGVTMPSHFFANAREEPTREISPLGTTPPAWLGEHSHYRLLPGYFPKGMTYHFDGLAVVAQFNFSATGKIMFTSLS